MTYMAWPKGLNKITVKKFDHIDRTDTDSLLNSVIGQNTELDSDLLRKNTDRFVAVLNKDYEESNTKICKTSDGHTVYEVVGDKERNYVVSRSYWDAILFVKESYTPDRTIVSAVCFGWDRDHYISDEKIIGCVLSLESNEEFFDDTDDLMESRSKGKKIHIKYGDEAVGECVGSVFRYDDQYMYKPCRGSSFSEPVISTIGFCNTNISSKW